MKKLILFACVLLSFTTHAQIQLWGMTSVGGQYGFGSIFKTDANGNNQTVQHSFYKLEAQSPIYSSLIQASDGKLYGMTKFGGLGGAGVLFEYNPITSICTKKIDFTGALNGSYPFGSLMQASDGKLYGMTQQGGSNNYGVIFQYDPVTSICTKKIDFAGTTTGSYPQGSLIQASDGKFYGMTTQGGANNLGVIFQYDPVTSIYIKKIDFSVTNGSGPTGSLMQASDGKLYGMTYSGGANSKGVLFQYDPVTSTYTKKLDFSGTTNGSNPVGSFMQASDGKLYGTTGAGGVSGFGVLFQYDPVTSTYTKKMDFTGTTNGYNPIGTLIQASDGKLYGMAYSGGVNNKGVIFQYDPVTLIYNKKIDFDGTTNGGNSYGSLMQASDGKLYGMTYSGGIGGTGVLFQYDPVAVTCTKKIDFNIALNGSNPFGSLMQASDGKLYGMTQEGGGTASNYGVLFQYDPVTLTYTKKLDFDGTSYGRNPQGSLIQSSDGKLYGMTTYGGTNSVGVLFQYDPVTSICTKKN